MAKADRPLTDGERGEVEDCLSRALGWEWAAVSLEAGSESYGVVSPSRSHVIFPLHYMQELLGDPECDQTSLLLNNMLKAGSLPPATPASTACSVEQDRPERESGRRRRGGCRFCR